MRLSELKRDEASVDDECDAGEEGEVEEVEEEEDIGDGRGELERKMGRKVSSDGGERGERERLTM